jgi:hypothetical protein
MLQIGFDFDARLDEIQDRLDAAINKAMEYYETVPGLKLDILHRDDITDELHRAVTNYMLSYAQGFHSLEHVKEPFQCWIKSCEVAA